MQSLETVLILRIRACERSGNGLTTNHGKFNDLITAILCLSLYVEI
jgi:hypothetical protein